VPPIGGVVEQV